MNNNPVLLWYGQAPPAPGVGERLTQRGYRIRENLPERDIGKVALTGPIVAVFNHIQDVTAFLGHIRSLIIQGAKIVVVATRSEHTAALSTFEEEPQDYPWKENLIFIPDFTGTHFDNFVCTPPAAGHPTKEIVIVQDERSDKLNREEEVLLRRAFPKAERLHVEPLTGGLSGSKVMIVHEHRREESIAHWAQPRLVKFGSRSELKNEVGHMKAVAPFVPFELRPNLDVFVEGYSMAVFVADFVEKSESLLAAARAGRGEAAISNLFNRTLYRWRGRGWQNDPRVGSLAVAAKQLKLMDVAKIHPDFLRIDRFERRGFDLPGLWAYLESLSVKHRSASIHGDLHGENIRVRGDDAILIDFGSVKGAQLGDAPLCFDVAMLEVALVFSADGTAKDSDFEVPGWEVGIRPYFKLDAIRRTPKREGVPNPVSWLFDCIQRIRAFGIYDQTDEDEYAIALAIALLRWCRWKPRTAHERGRRVIGLEIACEIIEEIRERRNESKKAA